VSHNKCPTLIITIIIDLNKSTVNINYNIRQVVPNINNSISKRKFPKTIITSIFQQYEVILAHYLNDIVNQFKCSFIITFMFNYLKNLYHVTT